MPKRNIYFPDDLVAKMKQHPKESWSAVCQEAVEARIRYLELRSDLATSAVERAKARLAPGKAVYIADAHARGERAGISWAADHASFEELRNLESATSSEDPTLLFPLPDGPMTSIVIARVISSVPDYAIDQESVSEDDIDRVHDLWGFAGLTQVSKDIESGHFWEGFVSGALRIYEQV
jgi:hypothetical protein